MLFVAVFPLLAVLLLLAAAVARIGGIEVAVSRRRRISVVGAEERLTGELAELLLREQARVEQLELAVDGLEVGLGALQRAAQLARL